MYWLDTTILSILGIAGILGFWSGLLWQVARVASLALATYASIVLHEPAEQLINEMLLRDADPRVAHVGAYAMVFLIVFLILYLVSRVLRETIRATQLEMMDRLLGAVLGMAKMAVVFGAAFMVLQNMKSSPTREVLERSALAPMFAHAMETGLALVPDEYKAGALESLAQLNSGFSKSH